jgi:hypothetical protein
MSRDIRQTWTDSQEYDSSQILLMRAVANKVLLALTEAQLIW